MSQWTDGGAGGSAPERVRRSGSRPDGKKLPLGGVIMAGSAGRSGRALFTRGSRGGPWQMLGEDSTGRAQLRIESWQLPELAMLSVDVGDSAATRLGSASDDGGIAVPVVPEVC